jgi:hypothetical protein
MIRFTEGEKRVVKKKTKSEIDAEDLRFRKMIKERIVKKRIALIRKVVKEEGLDKK